MIPALKWTAKTALYLFSLFYLSVMVLLLPDGMRWDRWSLGYRGFADAHYDFGLYWQSLGHYSSRLLRGEFLIDPPGGRIQIDGSLLMGEVGVSLTLILLALLVSVLLGAGLGYLLSRYSPKPLRHGAWTASTLLICLPDLLLMVALQIGFFVLSGWLGIRLPVYGRPLEAMTWRHYVVPLTALSLLPLPYLGRVVASGLEELGAQPFVQAAMARGLSPGRILWGHIGPNALIRIWAAVPAALGVLLSAVPIVEYIGEIPGVGRHLLQSPSGYEAALRLLPLLMVLVAAGALSSAAQRWLNPALRGEAAGMALLMPSEGTGSGSGGQGGDSGWRTLPGRLYEGARELTGWLLDQARAVPALPSRLWKALRSDAILLTGALMVTALILTALLADRISPHPWAFEEPLRIDGTTYTMPPFPPGPRNLLGSDQFGRDILSRLIWGTRFAMLVAFLAVPVRFGLAIPLGLVAAYRGGLAERLVRGLAAVFTSLPAVLLPLALLPGINNIFTGRAVGLAVAGILVLALPGAPRLAETVRLLTREILSHPYMEGARAAGASGLRLLLRHVMPNAVPSLVVLVALEIPIVLTTTAFLSLRKVYVGGAIWDPDGGHLLGPYMPEWGSMMTDPFRLLLMGRWWLWMPYAALFVAVLAFTLLGEGLRRRSVVRRTFG